MAQNKVQIGEPAPNFTLQNQEGTPISLSNFLGQKAVVLYFYPADNTAGCTAEACSFRDSYDVFKEAGAEVIGVSSDREETHKQFSAKHGLPFVLLSDHGGSARKLYGVQNTLGIIPGRVTYVIDKQGIVRHIFSSQFAAEKHITEALNVIQSLSKS